MAKDSFVLGISQHVEARPYQWSIHSKKFVTTVVLINDFKNNIFQCIINDIKTTYTCNWSTGCALGTKLRQRTNNHNNSKAQFGGQKPKANIHVCDCVDRGMTSH